jgi:hypothetical protein
MSTGQNESTGSSALSRLEANDLPIGLLDIELSTPPTELVGDTTTFLLRSEQGPPAAVLKVARGLRAAELRTQRRVLAELAIQQGLDDDWRALIPRILAFDERNDATVSVESYLPGMDLAEALARHPSSVALPRWSSSTTSAYYGDGSSNRSRVSGTCAVAWIPIGLEKWTDLERCYGGPSIVVVCR